MKQRIFKMFALVALLACGNAAYAQFNLKKAIGSASKTVQAFTLTDEQMAAYVKESVDWMDEHNPVLPADDPYTIRLNRLVDGITDADGIPLNFKVYNVIDVNAFACPDGSVRVFSSLMDIMNDDELLGVIGHEIGHVVKRHSKNAFKTQLLTAPLKMLWPRQRHRCRPHRVAARHSWRVAYQRQIFAEARIGSRRLRLRLPCEERQKPLGYRNVV